jgi:hypothetical protein
VALAAVCYSRLGLSGLFAVNMTLNRKGLSPRTVKRTVKSRRGKNPKSLANLQSFQPGQSGNPGGRPKKTKISDASREWLEQIDEKTGLTNAEFVVLAQGKQAKKGNTTAFNALADRTEGRPPHGQEMPCTPIRMVVLNPAHRSAIRTGSAAGDDA